MEWGELLEIREMAHTNKFKKMGEWQVKIQEVNFGGMLSLLWFGIKTSDRP
jgi:hypothetical protein